MRKFKQDEIEFIKECIKNHIPKNRIIKDVLHICPTHFKRLCKENGIDYPNFRKNKIWDNPFLDVNSPQVQYWLGWLATDGHISQSDKKCSLYLQEKDIDVIEKFNLFLGGKLTIRKVLHHKKYYQVGLKFRNNEIVSFLGTLGYNEQKTFNFYPNFEISWDYIRGCFEGDGYLRWGNTCEFTIVGASEKHIRLIYNFLSNEGFDVLWHVKSKYHKNPVYTVTLHKKKQLIQLLNKLYTNADTFMNRKYLLARSISNDTWKPLKFGEPALGIPSQADVSEGVTT